MRTIPSDSELQSGAKKSTDPLPDISRITKTQYAGVLTQVGMGQIEMPVLFVVGEGAPLYLPALIDAYVSLDDAEAKGIHMSRLYLELKNNFRLKPVTDFSLKEVLQKFLRSHDGLSQNAFIKVRFTLPLERRALVSGETGYRQYPIEFQASLKKDDFSFSLGAEILYSSTCPCSAALSRQLVRQDFLNQFGKVESVTTNDVLNWIEQDGGSVATPHAQRSVAQLKVRLRAGFSSLSVVELINAAEKALGTPVQAAVKRADEQEFARLNAENLMFCEDAARKLKHLFESDSRVSDYSIYVEHQESLHPHNAVSRVVRGEWT